MTQSDQIAWLRDQILLEHSKFQRDKILDWIGTDPERTSAFMEVYFDTDPVIRQRAAYVLGWLGNAHQKALEPYFPRILKEFEEDVHTSRIRNPLRLFETVNIPPRIQMDLMDHCFEFVQNPSRADAERAFAITVLGRLVKDYPELQREFLLILEEHLPDSAPSFRSRAVKMIKRLKKGFTTQ